jgi:hypothetical protein
MQSSSIVVRGAALTISVIAIAGLATNFAALYASTHSVLLAAWALLRYFTITTNILVAGIFIAIALSGNVLAAPKLMDCTVLSIVLVGVVYGLLLSGLRELSGGSLIADVLLHRITPIAVPLFWLCLIPKRNFRRRDPFIWALYPLGYFVYAIARGSVDGNYAYPFMDPVALGWARAVCNAAGIAVGFFAAGELFLWIDRQLTLATPIDAAA